MSSKKLPYQQLVDRFWSRTKKQGSCLIWTGHIDKDGYGKFSIREKVWYAHRFAYTLTKGNIPNGLNLDHLCRNRACINPNHLEAVTHLINVKRGNAGLHERIKTHCRQGHKYSKKNTRYAKENGFIKRVCRTCKRERARALRAKYGWRVVLAGGYSG